MLWRARAPLLNGLRTSDCHLTGLLTAHASRACCGPMLLQVSTHWQCSSRSGAGMQRDGSDKSVPSTAAAEPLAATRFSSVRDLLEERVGLDKDTSLAVASELKGQSVQEVDSWLSSFAERLKLKKASLRKILILLPTLPSHDFAKTLDPTITGLESYFKLDIESLRCIALKSPEMLLFDWERELKPKMEDIKRDWHLSNDQLRTVVVKSPTLPFDGFTYLQEMLKYTAQEFNKLLDRAQMVEELTSESKKETPKDLLKYFRLRPHVTPALTELQTRFKWKHEDLRHAIRRFPKLLGMSAEQAKSGLNALQTQLKLTDEGLKKLTAEMPSLIAMRTDRNLRPRVQFLCEQTGYTAEELGEAVLNGCTSLLIRSLHESIKPRFSKMKELGIPDEIILKRISYKDKKFDKFIARAKNGEVCWVGNKNEKQCKEKPIASCRRCQTKEFLSSASA